MADPMLIDDGELTDAALERSLAEPRVSMVLWSKIEDAGALADAELDRAARSAICYTRPPFCGRTDHAAEAE